MPTALQLINRGMRIARVLGKGEALDEDEAADGLTALNAMLDSWQTERLSVYKIESNTFTWTASQQSRTVGASGNFVLSRPARVDDSCVFVQNNIEIPVQLIDLDAWAGIPSKTVTSTVPTYLYPEYGTSIITLYVYPIPSASISFILRSWSRLQSFTALTTSMDLPMGYEDAIAYNFAERYCVEFGKELLPKAQRIAVNTKANIKRINAPSPIMATEVGQLNRMMSGYNIYTG